MKPVPCCHTTTGPFVLELGSDSEAEDEDEEETCASASAVATAAPRGVPQSSTSSTPTGNRSPSHQSSQSKDTQAATTTTTTDNNPSNSSDVDANLEQPRDKTLIQNVAAAAVAKNIQPGDNEVVDASSIAALLLKDPLEKKAMANGGSEKESVASANNTADTANPTTKNSLIHTLQPRQRRQSVPESQTEGRGPTTSTSIHQQQQKPTAISAPLPVKPADGVASRAALLTTAKPPKSSTTAATATATATSLQRNGNGGHDIEKTTLKSTETATSVECNGGHDNQSTTSSSSSSSESSSDNLLVVHSSPTKKSATAAATSSSPSASKLKDASTVPAVSLAQETILRNTSCTLPEELAEPTTTPTTVATAASTAELPVEDDHPSYRDEPTVASLQIQCWICAVPVQDPRTSSSVETIGWNVRHAHPLLRVPVCCVCAEEYAAHELFRANDNESEQQQQPPLDEPESDDGRCAGCLAGADDVDVLWLCDYPGSDGTCHRAFCFDCIAKATGHGAAERALTNDTNDPWYCPVCQPTRRVQQLQRSTTLPHAHRIVVGRAVETVLAELDAVEDEKKRCEQELERENIVVQAQEFRNDLLSQLTTADINASTTTTTPADDDLEEQVELAVQVWQEDWRRHHVRLSDRVAHLLDELDSDFNLSAAMCYNYIDTGKFDRDQGGSDDEDEDDWVRRANKVVNQRIKEREKEEPWNPLSREMYKNVFYDDVEELGSEGLEPDDVGSKLVRSGWTRNIRPEEDAIQAAMESEKKEFQRRRLKVKHLFDETQDKEEDNNTSAVARKRDCDRTCSEEDVDSRIVKRNRIDLSPLSSSRSPTSWTPSPNSASRSSVASDKKPMSSSRKSLFASPSNSTGGGSIHSNHSSKVSSAPIVLCKASAPTSQGGETAIRTITVSPSLSKKLKIHQAEGVRFMFDNSFSDFAVTKEGDPTRVGGCILAHCMGLGKTLSTITLLHTMMTNPSMQSKATGKPLVKKVLLIVPVNTIANWESEFDFWLREEKCQIVVYNFSEVDPKARGKRVQQWSDQGGVLLISERTFQPENFALLRNPDVLCLDEAHTMLKNSATGLYKKLSLVETPRKVALTGSPFQNNLNEYFQMVSYVRPGILGQENEFDRDFVTPITSGMPSDASDSQVLASLQKSKEMNQRLLPFVHRKDASVLRQDLPPLSQAVLTVRPTNMQTRMYRDYKRQKGKNNFFQHYQDLSLVNNHPASVLYTSKTSYDEAGKADTPTSADGAKWWERICDKLGGAEKVKGVMNGYKIVLLLHILAYCEKINDKVLIFALNLNTLNYIEEVLALEDWKKHVPALADKFPDMTLGGWRSGEDYLRIDGSTNCVDRGKLVDDFNAGARDGVKAFLLSRAGGIGINLCAANRVVLVDNHFNPTVATQAVFRAYRYGQEKPVFCYRLLTQGTMEEKVYARCVTKTGVALRVIDKRSINRNFTTRELQNMMQHLTWVQCDKCLKWRVLLGEESEEDLPAQWYCELNSADKCNNSCKAEEKDQLWYENYIANGLQETMAQPESPLRKAIDNARPDSFPVQIHTDPLLNILMELTDRGCQPLVSKHCYHDAMLESIDDSKELERLQREISERSESELKSDDVMVTEKANELIPNDHSDDQVDVTLPAEDLTMGSHAVVVAPASGASHPKDTRPPSDSGKLFNTGRVTDGAPSSAVATKLPDAAISKAEGQSPRQKNPSMATKPPCAAIVKADGKSPRQKKRPMAIKPGAAILKADGKSLRQQKLPMAIKPGAAFVKADGQSPRHKHPPETSRAKAKIRKAPPADAPQKSKKFPTLAPQKSTKIPHSHAMIDLCNVDAQSLDENLPQNSRKRTETKAGSPSKKSRPASPIRGTGVPGDAIDLCDSD